MEMTIIPKDCLLCDVCNREVVDRQGLVLAPFVWTDWGIFCDLHESSARTIRRFRQGDRVPFHHALWLPLVVTG